MNIKLENIELCVYEENNDLYNTLINRLEGDSKSPYIHDTNSLLQL